jgi:chitinase
MFDLIGRRLGQYEIIGQLGAGGMATVYHARQLNIKREVAIKVIKADLAANPDFIKRFEREAEAIASLSHPHILKLFDYGQEDNLVYLVMELLTGGTLEKMIQSGPLPVEKTVEIISQIASALDYAHQQGIVHRDLKPQNVLLDQQGNAFLSDFGIAKLVGATSALTQSGAALGTPTYMSPEQWRGEDLDARADIYSLGVMLYEMLTGKVPFRGDTPLSMMYMHLHDKPTLIHGLRPDLPSGVDSVIEKALEKERESRFASAGDLVAALKAALDGKKPTELALPAAAKPQRNMPVIIGVGVIATVLVIGGIAAVLAGAGAAKPSPTPVPATSQPATQAVALVFTNTATNTATNAPSSTLTATSTKTSTASATADPTTAPSLPPSATSTNSPTPTTAPTLAPSPTASLPATAALTQTALPTATLPPPTLTPSQAIAALAPTWPDRYFSPYLDTSVMAATLSQTSTDSGVKFFTLAFIIDGGTCNAAWGGGQPLDFLAADVNTIRSAGGDAMPSFGGFNTNELAVTCPDAKSLQAQYQTVIDAYNFSHLDFDINSTTLNNITANDRRNKALAGLQAAAKANGKTLFIAYSLPVGPSGLLANSLALLKNAVTNGVEVSTVNLLAMDYGASGTEMANAAAQAAKATQSQLAAIFPGKTSAQLWQMIGVTPMIGINDTKGETFTLADAASLLTSLQKNDARRISMWSLGRDAQCADDSSAEPAPLCSGIKQTTYQFASVFNAFTGNAVIRH